MRILATPIGLLLILSACTSPDQTADEAATPVEGTWEYVTGQITTPDTTVNYPDLTPAPIKMLNATHFATGRQSGDSTIYANGGRYIYEDSTYTEIIRYHSTGSEVVGDTVTFDSEIKGDSIWTFSGETAQGLMLTETWRRIE